MWFIYKVFPPVLRENGCRDEKEKTKEIQRYQHGESSVAGRVGDTAAGETRREQEARQPSLGKLLADADRLEHRDWARFESKATSWPKQFPALALRIVSFQSIIFNLLHLTFGSFRRSGKTGNPSNDV